MGKIVIIKKRCPCCKYVYRTREHKEVVQESGETVEKTLSSNKYVAIGKSMGKGICVGGKDFIPVNVVGEFGNINTIAVECPKCGVHINPEKCITKEEKEI